MSGEKASPTPALPLLKSGESTRCSGEGGSHRSQDIPSPGQFSFFENFQERGNEGVRRYGQVPISIG